MKIRIESFVVRGGQCPLEAFAVNGLSVRAEASLWDESWTFLKDPQGAPESELQSTESDDVTDDGYSDWSLDSEDNHDNELETERFLDFLPIP